MNRSPFPPDFDNNNDVTHGSSVGPNNNKPPNDGKPDKKKPDDPETAQLISEVDDVTRALGNRDVNSVAEDKEELFKLREDITEIATPNKAKEISDYYNLMTITKFKTEVSTSNLLDWLLFLQLVFANITEIKGSDEVVILDVDYFNKLPEILLKYSLRTLHNYALLKVVEELMEKTGFIPSLEETLGLSTQPRWQLCLEEVNILYPYAITRMFIDEHGQRKINKRAREFVGEIKQSLKQVISSSSWLDSETKKRSLQKIQRMNEYVGYPEWILSDDKLDEHYRSVNTSWNSVKSLITLLKDKKLRQLSNLAKSASISEWDTLKMFEVNAFNNIQENKIVVALGILQQPFYIDEDYMAAVNFGAVGAIIGHEFGHAFDDAGRQFNENGDLIEWWTNDSIRTYTRKCDCYIDQYNNFCPPEFLLDLSDNVTCLDGMDTLGENVADNMGLRISFKSYEAWTRKKGRDKKLPGLSEFDSKKLFFISYGHMWCENYLANTYKYYAINDNHSPKRYRVLGALSNFKQFSEAFECPSGSAMNRGSDSCTLW